jgi:hypothetical protein
LDLILDVFVFPFLWLNLLFLNSTALRAKGRKRKRRRPKANQISTSLVSWKEEIERKDHQITKSDSQRPLRSAIGLWSLSLLSGLLFLVSSFQETEARPTAIAPFAR